MVMLRFLLVLLVLMGSGLGCAPQHEAADYEPVEYELSRLVSSPMKLEDAIRLLGEPHPPTVQQKQEMDMGISLLPEPDRTTGSGDQQYAWGNDEKFLIVLVDKDGIIRFDVKRY